MTTATRKRQTFSVDKLRNYINLRLADRDVPRQTKLELCILLEDILMRTGNYKGFNWVGVSYEEAANIMPDHVRYGNRYYY